jgi:hypothetical protein
MATNTTPRNIEAQLPKYMVAGLLAAFHNYRSDERDGFPVRDDKINMALSRRYGLFTDAERVEFDTGCGMRVYFDWRLQAWRIY